MYVVCVVRAVCVWCERVVCCVRACAMVWLAGLCVCVCVCVRVVVGVICTLCVVCWPVGGVNGCVIRGLMCCGCFWCGVPHVRSVRMCCGVVLLCVWRCAPFVWLQCALCAHVCVRPAVVTCRGWCGAICRVCVCCVCVWHKICCCCAWSGWRLWLVLLWRLWFG